MIGGLAAAAADAQDTRRDADLESRSRSIKTTSKPAQAAFDRGLRLAYGVARAEAIEFVKQAQAYEPACAVCAWGEAWVTGPYQNNPAGAGDAPDAQAAAERAHGLAINAAPWERALIAAMRLRYRSDDGPDHDAEACADQLAAVVAGIGHLQPMPSHIDEHLGRYRNAVRANQVARAAERGEAVAVDPTHNTMMLMFSASLDGQSAVAIAAARDLAVERPADVHQQYLMLARFGRWNALLAASEGPESAFESAMWRFARGLAQLRTGDHAGARKALGKVVSARTAIDPEATYHLFGHRHRCLLGIAENIVAGEIRAADGEREQATDRLRAAVALEDGLGDSEPEPWPLPARDFLGARLPGGVSTADVPSRPHAGSPTLVGLIS